MALVELNPAMSKVNVSAGVIRLKFGADRFGGG